MSQNSLLNMNLLAAKVVDMEWVHAVFVKSDKNSYDVSLNINSQKFLLRFTDDCGLISAFEVVSFKGFMINLTNSLVVALRNLIEVLRSKL